MYNEINLETLTDRQKIWLSQLSYLDISKEGRDKIKNGGLTVSELRQHLVNSGNPFCGSAVFNGDTFNFLADKVVGKDLIASKEEVLESIIKCGLGDLRITDISDEQKFASSGFQALTFVDSKGNVGISYRGSDFDFSKGGVRDWVESDFLEYFTNDSTQRSEALEYFNANKSHSGNNYIYGHSLGGNLVSHVYLENYDAIQQAFSINGNPINQKLIDTPEKVDAFNNKDKFSFNIVCGDIVGHLKSCDLYKNNVNFIRNNGTAKPSIISSHLVQASTFDEYGNFICASEEEMIEAMGMVETAFTSFAQYVREALNDIGYKLNDASMTVKNIFAEYSEQLISSFEKKFASLNYGKLQGERSKANEVLINEFQSAAKIAENEQMERIRMQITERKSTITNEVNAVQNNMYDNFFDETEENYSRTR